MYSSDNDIEAIARGLIDHTLPKPEWTHGAHFAAAVWLIQSPDHDAERDMPGLIRAYNEACGVANTDTEGYHETITKASIRAAAHCMSQNPTRGLAEATNTVLRSGFGKADWILAYWTRERLFSVEARRNWVAPDRQNLPF
ncbi:MAG: hypothetical protein CMK07_07790 [Ponticaulis sp.]|nr:hypothetical protein [Ponticaulis sp.]